MSDNAEPILTKDSSSTDLPFAKLKSWQWWLLVSLNIVLLLFGQFAAVLLGRFYYDKGGNSTWLATLLQTAAFPILFIPYFIIGSSQKPTETANSASRLHVYLVYIVLGAIIAGDNMLYSVGLLYLSASTYSILCATQLVSNAIFSFFINQQKFTILILNSVVVLTLSASLLGVNGDSTEPSGVSKGKYVIGFVSTLGASALYSLILSLMQLSFQKVIKKETFSVVLEMQIYTSVVATGICIIGLFASGDWKTLHGEMNTFSTGRLSYVLTLVWTGVAWQVCAVGVVGLIYIVSSLFSNVISTLSLALTPVAALIVFHDKMNGVKIIAMLLGIWGSISYIYQNYLDDAKVRKTRTTAEAPLNDSIC
ncbi:OLC1v1000320C1 [Oldenlandia corymbosa var. corymbosa]|uniref:Probable purine permease n=1 Tax=Oldenlandia corymbosa var. corymbosa TaxID=529605 RepID=A0AAV1D428_OLDCO|nr:OLC1v1000320C1 [Oldenlandia corymbosa var. corymbosa]